MKQYLHFNAGKGNTAITHESPESWRKWVWRNTESQ